MTNSVGDLTEADVVLLIGSNTTTAHPVISMQLNQSLRRGMKLIVVDPRKTTLARKADFFLQIRGGTDIALLKGMMRVIADEGLQDDGFIRDRTENYEELVAGLNEMTVEEYAATCGVAVEDMAAAARLFARSGYGAIAYCLGVTQHTHGTDNVRCIADLAMMTGHVGRPGTGVNPLRGANNVQGCCDMGGLVSLLPGYQPVDSDEARARYGEAWGAELSPVIGKTLTEMVDAANAGELKAMYIMGENPMLSDPDVNHVRSGLENLDFLVVQDIFLTETAQLADVVLPGATFAEKDGTFTNTERRVQRVRKAVDPVGDARPDWLIVRDVANLMGSGWDYDSAADVMDEVNRLVPQYGGTSYERLEQCGLQWPCPDKDHPGTRILHMENFICGKGKMADISYREAQELPDEEYPFVFNTGRHLMHFHSGSMSRRSRSLDILDPEALIDINPEDAVRLGIKEGDMVTLASRRGELTAKAMITTRSAPGTVFMPFHYAEAAANLLTNSARDPICKSPELKVCAVRIEKSR